MAVTTSFTMQFEKAVDLPQEASSPDLLALADGGYETVADSTTAGRVHRAHINHNGATRAQGDITGSHASLAQLQDGDIVTAVQTAAGGIAFAVDPAAGGLGARQTIAGAWTDSAPDVAALTGGGFVVATTHVDGGGDNDIVVYQRDATGAAVRTIQVASGAENDSAPSIAALDDGGFAIAWTRTLANTHTQVWEAVTNADGSVRLAPTLLAGTGDDSKDASVVALDNGGFAVAYAHIQQRASINSSGYGDVDVVTLNASGTILSSVTVGSDPNKNDSQPYLTQLAPGLIALSFTDRISNNPSSIAMSVFDDSGSALFSNPVLISNDPNVVIGSDSAAAGLAGGRLLEAYFNQLSGHIDGGVFDLVRISNSDAANDTLVGDDLVDHMSGGAGNDILKGMGGDDVLNGGDGADNLNGGLGRDTADYSGASAGVHVDLSIATRQNTIGAGADLLVSIENLRGTSYADTLIGNNGANVLFGGDGHDHLTGGGGADLFRYEFLGDSTPTTRDTITDFQQGTDKIDLSAFERYSTWFTMSWIGTADFSHHGGEIRETAHGSDTLIELDAYGFGSPSFEIILTGAYTLTAADFIF